MKKGGTDIIVGSVTFLAFLEVPVSQFLLKGRYKEETVSYEGILYF